MSGSPAPLACLILALAAGSARSAAVAGGAEAIPAVPAIEAVSETPALAPALPEAAAMTALPALPALVAPETALIERAKAGDQAAFGELVAPQKEALVRRTLRLMGNRQDAEDAAQEVLLKAYQHLSSFRSGSKFTTWLYTIAANQAFDGLRKRRRRVDNGPSLDAAREGEEGPIRTDYADESTPDGRETLARAELRSGINRAVARLSPEQREAFIMGEVDGLSEGEASRALGIKTNTFRSRLFRARESLRRILAEDSSTQDWVPPKLVR